MTIQLSNDIFSLIFLEFRLREDFASLFSCAQTCRTLAPLALANMYRSSKISPASDEESEGFQVIGGLLLVERWTVLWRSIILASLGQTLYPYHHYLRLLDLRDLQNLLDDNKFSGEIQRVFFGEPLAQFHYTKKVVASSRAVRLDLPQIIEKVGDTLAPKIPLLEELSGNFTSQAFLKWAPGLHRLQRLELWSGEVLGDEAVHQAIYKHCPKFEGLSIYQWRNGEPDQQLGKFITGLPSQSLQSLVTISSCGISTDTCAALQLHNESLKQLQLNVHPGSAPSLALLKSCTAVENLHLHLFEWFGLQEFRRQYPAAFDETKEWLAACRILKEVSLTDFDPGLLIPLLLSHETDLEELSINGLRNFYMVKDNREFHLALANQKNLHTLCLRGDGDGVAYDDLEILVDSVRQLKKLRKLELRGVAESFNDEWTIRLLSPLQELKEIYIGGYGISDEVLEVIASLRNLRRITFASLSNFTLNGLYNFILKLEPGNSGIQIAIDSADPASLLTDEELTILRDLLDNRVGGTLEYIPLRDPDLSDFEGESD